LDDSFDGHRLDYRPGGSAPPPPVRKVLPYQPPKPFVLQGPSHPFVVAIGGYLRSAVLTVAAGLAVLVILGIVVFVVLVFVSALRHR